MYRGVTRYNGVAIGCNGGVTRFNWVCQGV